MIYLGSNIKDVKPEQLRDAVNEAFEEGGAMMSTVFQQVLEKGKEIGVKEGKDEEKLRVAMTCLKKGIDINTVVEITGLPIERIELLKSFIQQENSGHQ
ncbi:MAG: hypothetical protein JSV88_14200 [Candidatus Aminicenantes bacterium]|nr:MAG: hypothetical protein JSV88_14200 [Candidatus Aminicenantes bacterium]